MLMDKFRVFRSEHYKGKLLKLDKSEGNRVRKFEQGLKDQPFSGKPLGYKFFREKKFNGKRILFLVYEEHKSVFLITITDKKAQQYEIDLIKTNLDVYKNELEDIIKKI
jgi:mRNA-degrading endonuclease RelE of RelBE toxin-antitoxin system